MRRSKKTKTDTILERGYNLLKDTLRNILDKFLQYTRRGKVNNMQKTSVQISEAIQQSVKSIYSEIAESNGLRMTMQFTDSKDATILSPSNIMAQSVQLVSNAFRGNITSKVIDYKIKILSENVMANSASEAQLDSLDKFIKYGEEPTIKWSAYLDKSTCKVCRSRDGKTYTKSNLPQHPAHPNCRCTLEIIN